MSMLLHNFSSAPLSAIWPSSFNYAKERWKITKKHTFMHFRGAEWSSTTTSLNEWLISFVFFVFSLLPWHVHLQIEVVKTGRRYHRSTHPYSWLSQQDLSVAPYTCVRAGEKRQYKEVFQNFTFNKTDCRSLCKWKHWAQKSAFQMLEIGNPHPQKENKFLFI